MENADSRCLTSFDLCNNVSKTVEATWRKFLFIERKMWLPLILWLELRVMYFVSYCFILRTRVLFMFCLPYVYGLDNPNDTGWKVKLWNILHYPVIFFIFRLFFYCPHCPPYFFSNASHVCSSNFKWGYAAHTTTNVYICTCTSWSHFS